MKWFINDYGDEGITKGDYVDKQAEYSWVDPDPMTCGDDCWGPSMNFDEYMDVNLDGVYNADDVRLNAETRAGMDW